MRLRRYLMAVCLMVFAFDAAAQAQQPFFTDDTDVTPAHQRHVECSEELDKLQPESFPSLRQNTIVCKVAIGIGHGIEVGADAPILTIFNAKGAQPRTSLGIGDTDFAALKWKFFSGKDGTRQPSFAAEFNVEIPTGRAKEQLGSGETDYVANFVYQQPLRHNNTLRGNFGTIFAGNQTTGVEGVANPSGQVYTFGTSLVHRYGARLQLGVEGVGAFSPQLNASRGMLQFLGGGNYEVLKGYTFDFGLLGGALTASPRVGVQLGFSHNF